MKKGSEDDLAELRRMIKATDENLGDYSRQVPFLITQMHTTKKEVLNAASQFKSQIDFDLSYKFNRLKSPAGKKATSMVRIRDPRYN